MAELARRQALKLYYGLLRAQRTAFCGDAELLRAARQRTREEFTRPIGSDELLSRRLREAAETIELLQHNIVQAERTTLPHYYRLHFRPGLEINDGHVRGRIKKCC